MEIKYCSHLCLFRPSGLNVNVQMVWSYLLIKRVAYVSAYQFIHRRAVMKFLVTWYLLLHT